MKFFLKYFLLGFFALGAELSYAYKPALLWSQPHTTIEFSPELTASGTLKIYTVEGENLLGRLGAGIFEWYRVELVDARIQGEGDPLRSYILYDSTRLKDSSGRKFVEDERLFLSRQILMELLALRGGRWIFDARARRRLGSLTAMNLKIAMIDLSHVYSVTSAEGTYTMVSGEKEVKDMMALSSLKTCWGLFGILWGGRDIF